MKSRLLALLLLVFIWAPVVAQDLGEGIYRIETQTRATPLHLKLEGTGPKAAALGNTPSAANWKLVPVPGTKYVHIQHPQNPAIFLQISHPKDGLPPVIAGPIPPGKDPSYAWWRFDKVPNVKNGYTIGMPDSLNHVVLLTVDKRELYLEAFMGDIAEAHATAAWSVTLIDPVAQAARDRANASKPAPSMWIVN